MSNEDAPSNTIDNKAHIEILDGIYNEVIENLRNFSAANENSPETDENNLSNNVVVDIWETQNKVSKEYIEKIIIENIQLKNELRSIKSQLKFLKDKTEEILICSNNPLEQNLQQDNSNKHATNIILYPTNFSTVNNIERTDDNHEAKIDKITSKDLEEINENLNRIRDLIKKSSSQEKITMKLAKMVPMTKNTFLNKILLSDINTKGIEALIEKLPRLIPEEFVKVCKSCRGIFSVCRWKYHCRVCGYVYCFHCSNNYDNFIPFYLNSVRMCDDCFRDKKNQVYLS